MSTTVTTSTIELIVCFGKDQSIGVKNLLSSMRKDGKVLYSEMQDADFIKSEPMDSYTITFDSAYSLYEFGWKSAELHAYMNFNG